MAGRTTPCWIEPGALNPPVSSTWVTRSLRSAARWPVRPSLATTGPGTRSTSASSAWRWPPTPPAPPVVLPWWPCCSPPAPSRSASAGACCPGARPLPPRGGYCWPAWPACSPPWRPPPLVALVLARSGGWFSAPWLAVLGVRCPGRRGHRRRARGLEQACPPPAGSPRCRSGWHWPEDWCSGARCWRWRPSRRSVPATSP